MRCRWMLYLEEIEADVLHILPGVPRAWMKDKKNIMIDGTSTYFGKLYLNVISDLSASGCINITVRIEGKRDRLPKKINVRLPHPKGNKAKSVSLGCYDAHYENITINNFTGQVELKVYF
jgi:hypothetical protein